MRALQSYASSFASFLLDSPIGEKINKIILFGSAARGDATTESDIDLFLEADEKIEKEVTKMISLFKASQAAQRWKLKGIANEISCQVGRLSQWSLRREVISSGIILYGKYEQLPENSKPYLLIILQNPKAKVAKQMQIWRKMYGYSQKVGKKRYRSKGLVEESGGKKLGKATLLLPMEKRRKVLEFLHKNKISYVLYEIWSDVL